LNSRLLIADDGDATPYPVSGSEAFRFVRYSRIASRDSQAAFRSPGA